MKQMTFKNSYLTMIFFLHFFTLDQLSLMKKELEDGSICSNVVFDALFRKYSRELHDFLHYKFGASRNPADVVQDAFIKLWKNCHKVHPDKARSFLYTVANNQMLNEISKEKTALNYRMQKPSGHTAETPEFVLEEKQYMYRLQAAIEALTPDQRVTFMLNRIEGKKHEEIAQMLGISRKTVEKRIYTALAKLREKIGDI
jgi:RNA polymerase sigma-70 factor (ECF subfamily)